MRINFVLLFLMMSCVSYLTLNASQVADALSVSSSTCVEVHRYQYAIPQLQAVYAFCFAVTVVPDLLADHFSPWDIFLYRRLKRFPIDQERLEQFEKEGLKVSSNKMEYPFLEEGTREHYATQRRVQQVLKAKQMCPVRTEKRYERKKHNSR